MSTIIADAPAGYQDWPDIRTINGRMLTPDSVAYAIAIAAGRRLTLPVSRGRSASGAGDRCDLATVQRPTGLEFELLCGRRRDVLPPERRDETGDVDVVAILGDDGDDLS